jgi:nucleoside-diphosphate-sugar epimerase
MSASSSTSTRPPTALVTGCAGFIGSQLAERLVAEGLNVVGVDCFTDFYERDLKERNVAWLRDHDRFKLHELDLSCDQLDGLLDGVDVVYHLAAQAGVRGSFGETFAVYLRNNVHATQRLLEQAAGASLERFVYASSSSIYGDALAYPTPETAAPRPVSPYGMTKVATEELAGVYYRTRGVPVVGLRYFTVYGPRQRPDMAFTRFLTRALRGEELTIYGDGRQVRDFTFVEDIVDGTLAAAAHGRAGGVYNIGGGSPVRLSDVLVMLRELVERPLRIRHAPGPLGEAHRTGADCTRTAAELGFTPTTPLRTGLAAQLRWLEGVVSSTREQDGAWSKSRRRTAALSATTRA